MVDPFIQVLVRARLIQQTSRNPEATASKRSEQSMIQKFRIHKTQHCPGILNVEVAFLQIQRCSFNVVELPPHRSLPNQQIRFLT